MSLRRGGSVVLAPAPSAALPVPAAPARSGPPLRGSRGRPLRRCRFDARKVFAATRPASGRGGACHAIERRVTGCRASLACIAGSTLSSWVLYEVVVVGSMTSSSAQWC